MTVRPRSALAGLCAVLCLAAASPSASTVPGSALRPPPQLVAPIVPALAWPDPPAATATAYVLMDVETGQVLAERAPDTRRPVASTVKVLTALTVLTRTAPDDVVRVGGEVSRVGGAGVGLRPGDRWSVRELLDALIVRSGNDAAVALAVHVGGSVEGFVELMREDAEALGLTGLVLSSPSGLVDRNRLSARDLAVITRAALADPTFRDLSAQATVALPRLGTVRTRNDLLTSYDGATGVKTGYTDAAGWSFIGAAERDGRELVVVVLDARSSTARFQDAARLLDHGFSAFSRRQVEVEGRLRVDGGWQEFHAGPLVLLVPGDDPDGLSVDPLLRPEQDAVPDEVALRWQGQVLAELPVIEDDAGGSSQTPAARHEGSAAIGSFLIDRVYAGLRARALDGA